MIDLCSSCLDDGMKEVYQRFGVGVLQILAVGVCKESSDGLDEFGRHFQFFLRVDFEFQSSHTLEQVLDLRFGLFSRGRSISRQFADEAVADCEESKVSQNTFRGHTECLTDTQAARFGDWRPLYGVGIGYVPLIFLCDRH